MWAAAVCVAQNRWTELRDWQFRREIDTIWTAVALPHSCNAEDGRSAHYYRGLAHYKREFLKAQGAPVRTFLYFMGAAQKCVVRVNGTLAYRHAGGYTPFVVDATEYVHTGANTIEVDCDNSLDTNLAPVSSDFNKNNGLHNPVYAVETDNIFLNLEKTGYDGVHLTPFNISSRQASIGVSTVVSNLDAVEAKLRALIRIKDRDGRTVASKKVSLRLPANKETPLREVLTVRSPHLWQGLDDPYLYSADLVVKKGNKIVCRATATTGIRTIGMDSVRGFLLNGRSYPLRGMSLHQDWAHSASAVTRSQTDRDFQIIADLGMNIVRLAHYPHNRYVLHKCDSLGLIVQTEIPWVNECGNDTTLYSQSIYSANLHSQLREMITAHYNHPSIAFWGLWNELGNIDGSHPQGKRLDKQAVLRTTASLYALAHRLDSTRFVGFADAAFGMNTPELKRGTHFDYFAFNAYNGWYSNCSSPEGASRFSSTLQRLRRRSPYAAITEYGAGANPFCHSEAPQRTTRPSVGGARHDEQWGNIVHERHLQVLAQTPWLQYSTGWILFDFAVASRREGWVTDSLLKATPAGQKPQMPPFAAWLNDKGLVTRDRQTFKDSYFLYRAAWNHRSPTLYITERRFRERHSDTVTIKVYSNLHSLRLYQNGELRQTMEQTGEPSGVIWEFAPVRFQTASDVFRVTGTDEHGREYRDEVTFTTLSK